MKLVKIALLLIIPAILSSFAAHKFYVSITKIEHSVENQSIQIINTMFIDDIEDVLQQRYDPSLILGAEVETKDVEELMQQYIMLKLKIEINGEAVNLEYVGHKYEADVVKTYLEVSDVSEVKSIQIENKLLMEVFEEQQNIIHYKRNKKRKSIMLDRDNPKGVLNF